MDQIAVVKGPFQEVNFTVSSHYKTRQAAKELLEKGSSLTVFVFNWTKSQKQLCPVTAL